MTVVTAKPYHCLGEFVKNRNKFLGLSAVGIEADKPEVFRTIAMVDLIEIHVALAHAAIDQGFPGAAAGSAPLAESKQQIVTGPAFDDGGAQGALLAQPAAAAVKADGNQGVKHALGGFQVILVNKGVDLFFTGLQMLPEQLVSLLFGNAGFPPLLQLILGYGGAVADTVVIYIPVGLGLEALPNLYNFDKGIAAGIGRRGEDLQGTGANQRNEHCQCKRHSQNSSCHDSVSSQIVLMPEA